MKKSFDENSVTVDDPTTTGVLRELLRDTLDDQKVQTLITSLKARKISLVLSGGGGKGAYQAGVILALHDCDIKNFLSIAGTSVGGLNGALCHELCRLGDRNLVLNIWGKITYKSVLAVTLGFPLKLVIYAIESMHIINDTKRFITDKVGATVTILDADPELDSPLDYIKKFIISLISMLVILCICMLMFWWGIRLYIFALPFLITTLESTLKIRSNISSAILPYVFFIFLPILATLVGRSFALLSNAPLRRTIETLNINAICDGKPPVICTLAQRIPSWIRRKLLFSNTFIPCYVPLNTRSRQWALDVLLQTAAIPEVFPARWIFGRRFVDGGMADNTPIFGVFEQQPNTLIVIYLDHRLSRIKDLPQREWRRLSLIIRSLGGDEDNEMMCWAAKTIKKNMIAIIPSKPLGGPLGTLNFGTINARQLIALGYEDTLRQLAKSEDWII